MNETTYYKQLTKSSSRCRSEPVSLFGATSAWARYKAVAVAIHWNTRLLVGKVPVT